MDKIKIRAIVLKEILIGEADKLIVLLAKGMGKITVKARGARNAKSKTACGASVFSYCDYIAVKTKAGYSITQAEPIKSFYEIGNDIEKLAYSSAAVEIAEKVCSQDQPDDDNMFLLLNMLNNVASGKTTPRTAFLIYLIKFLNNYGCMPETNCDCGEKAEYCGESGFYCRKCRKPHNIYVSDLACELINTIIGEDIKHCFDFVIGEELLSRAEKAAKLIFFGNIDVKIRSWDFTEKFSK